MAAMETCTIKSKSRNAFIDITQEIQEFVSESGIRAGYCVLHVPHTTAAVTVNEGADPSVQTDILTYLADRVPHRGTYRHMEGNSDSHIKASMIGSSVTILVEKGQLVLGTWQKVFFCEFDGPRSRKVYIKFS